MRIRNKLLEMYFYQHAVLFIMDHIQDLSDHNYNGEVNKN